MEDYKYDDNIPQPIFDRREEIPQRVIYSRDIKRVFTALTSHINRLVESNPQLVSSNDIDTLLSRPLIVSDNDNLMLDNIPLVIYELVRNLIYANLLWDWINELRKTKKSNLTAIEYIVKNIITQMFLLSIEKNFADSLEKMILSDIVPGKIDITIQSDTLQVLIDNGFINQ
jgi:uncharacterized protein YnzC (UPF0291/DUF896 family)